MISSDYLAAERYAESLFQIVSPGKEDEEMEAELLAFSQSLKRAPELEKFLMNPQFHAGEKRKALERIYQKSGVQKTLLDFLTLILKKNRFYLIHEIVAGFKKIADTAQGQAIAEIRTAVPISTQDEATIVARLERMAGYKIEVSRHIDPSLVGGVYVKLRNQVLDGSVRGKLGKLKEQMLKAKVI